MEAEAAVSALCAAHPEPWADWSEELRDELARLRRNLANANAAIGQHALVVEARQAGCRHQTVQAARELARAEVEAAA